jgi:5-methyltetrahydrofolate--homocysteine methyltransferase
MLKNLFTEEGDVDILEEIAIGVEKGDSNSVLALTEKALTQNISVGEILNNGLVAGMDVIGEKFKNNEVFIPEVLISAKAMKAGMELIKPLLAKANVESKGKVVIGTVKGDLHDIGKRIIAMLLEGAGFEVTDLGADVSKEKFLEFVENASHYIK